MIASVSTFQDMNEINISLILEGVFHVCLVTSLFTTTSLFCLSLLILAIILVCSFALLLIFYVASSGFVSVFLWSATSPPSNSSSTRSEEHTSELQSPVPISYAVFCLKKKKKKIPYTLF